MVKPRQGRGGSFPKPSPIFSLLSDTPPCWVIAPSPPPPSRFFLGTREISRFLFVTPSSELAAEEPRLIITGKSGGGKSATGNSLLGRKEFESLTEAKTTTLRCKRGRGTWEGVKITVIDTPALFDAKGYDEVVRREIAACIELSRPGPHVLILVTQVGRFTDEDAAAAKCVREIFGPESTRHMIVLFTCVEDLGGDPLQEYVQKSNNRNLQEVIRLCGNRFCGFNNKATGDERARQVAVLMEMVQRIISANGYYTNWLYKLPNVQDEHVKVFLAKNRTGRARVAGRPWTSNRIVIVAVLGSLLLIIVVAIILMASLL